LGCEEANGREAMAQVLAKTPSMTVEDARRIMAAAPLSAQARSETALDDMMRGAPAPVTSTSVPVGADDNDLLAIPV
ncbi:MAG: S49 family peptidase, partial [Plesiomonas shigelloides]